MSTKSKQKKPFFGGTPEINRIPCAKDVPNNHLQPEFKACKMDMDGKWGWSGFSSYHLREFLNKLFDCQKLTWQDLYYNGSHRILVSQIVPEARKRLQNLLLDEWEELYSLRLAGKQRVWGLKEGRIFWLLWWDPEHEICPSLKKS